jgi:hypothetical protein
MVAGLVDDCGSRPIAIDPTALVVDHVGVAVVLAGIAVADHAVLGFDRTDLKFAVNHPGFGFPAGRTRSR